MAKPPKKKKKTKGAPSAEGDGSPRPELLEVIRRHAFTLDENRPEAVAKRAEKNRRMGA
jgi:hypothetical protein